LELDDGADWRLWRKMGRCVGLLRAQPMGIPRQEWHGPQLMLGLGVPSRPSSVLSSSASTNNANTANQQPVTGSFAVTQQQVLSVKRTLHCGAGLEHEDIVPFLVLRTSPSVCLFRLLPPAPEHVTLRCVKRGRGSAFQTPTLTHKHAMRTIHHCWIQERLGPVRRPSHKLRIKF